MPHCKQAAKRARQAVTRQDFNLAAKRRIKTQVKRVLDCVTNRQADQAQKEFLSATRLLDKAASSGVLHPNNSRRRISRLALKVRQVKAAGA